MKWKGILWWSHPRPSVPLPDRDGRIRNEIQQLISIRDDAFRVSPGSPLHHWLNGAIFALEWGADPYHTEPPSGPAARRRSGIES